MKTNYKDKIKIEYLNDKNIDRVLEINSLSFKTKWNKDSFKKELQNSFVHYITASLNDTIIGYAGVWIVLDEASIISIAIDPKFRGLGISNDLMNSLFNICAKNNVTLLTLEVRKSNTIAQNLYEKFGFKKECIRKNYYKDKEDAIIMLNKNIDKKTTI